MNTSNAPARSPRAFTLIELLIVIGSITILIALGLSVAGKVSGTGKYRATEQTLRALDQILTDYIQTKGANPEPWVVDPRPTNSNQRYIQPVADAPNMSGAGTKLINSVGLFLLQCKEVSSAEEKLKGLDAKLVKVLDVDSDTTPQAPSNYADQWPITTVLDGWGNPIHYVHPVFKGLVPDPSTGGPVDLSVANPYVQTPAGKLWGISQIKRHTVNPGGTDGGLNPSNRPYFYSAGPDGDPTTTEDNVYLVAPRFKKS